MRAQIWSADFIIALIIVSAMAVVFLQFILNQPDPETSARLQTEALRISETLMTSGSPTNWTAADVKTAGIIDAGEINGTKLDALYTMPSAKVRQSLGIESRFQISLYKKGVLQTIAGEPYVGGAISTERSLVSISRYALYNDEIVEVRIALW